MRQRGAAGSEVALIFFVVIYILAIGWMANSMQGAFGFSAPVLTAFSGWSLPYVSTGVSILDYFVDFFTFIINIFAWIISSLGSFFVLMGYSVQGDIPAWLTTLAFIPIAFPLGWMIISVVRGR